MNIEGATDEDAAPMASTGDPAARAVSMAPLRVAAWIAATLIVWWSVATSKFAFDKDVTLYVYPQVAGGFGTWAWLAAITHKLGMSGESFYAVVSLPYAAAQVYLVRQLSSRSTLLAVAFGMLFLSWFGYGQLRYGTALVLLMVAIEQHKEHRGAAVAALLLAITTHAVAAVGLLGLIAWRALLRGGLLLRALAVGAAIYLALGLGDLSTPAGAILAATGYEDYLYWLDLDAPSTIFKYVFLLVVLGASSLAGNQALREELLLVFLMLPSALLPPFAGRGYHFFFAVLLARMCQRPASEMPPGWVNVALAAAMLVDVVRLWTGGLHSF
jgi:hypothetical protein